MGGFALSVGYRPRSLTLGRLGTGLNNQRLCLLGLFELARESGRAVTLPASLENFTPSLGRRREQPDLPIWDLYDHDSFHAAVAGGPPLIPTGDAEEIDMHTAFRAGAAASRRARPDNFAGRFLIGVRAADGIVASASALDAWLDERGCGAAFQLRIEKDWSAYYRKRGLPGDDPVLDVRWMLARVRKICPSAKVLWACCDDADLPISVADLRAIGREQGLELLFKEQLPAGLPIPRDSPKRAMMDFTLCRRMPVYLGVTRSSFSQLLVLINRLEGGPRHADFLDGDPVPASDEHSR